MASAGRSQTLVQILIVVALLGAAVGGQFMMVNRFPVAPRSVIKDPLVYEVVRPTLSREDVLYESNKFLPEFWLRDDVQPLLDTYRELDKDRGVKSVKEVFGKWSAWLVVTNMALVLPIIFIALNYTVVVAILSSLACAGLAFASFLFFHLPNLQAQLNFILLSGFTRLSEEEWGVMEREFGSYADQLVSGLRFTTQIQAGLLVITGLVCWFLYERVSNFVMGELQAKSNELQSVQAEMFSLQNVRDDLTKLDKKYFKLTSRMTSLQAFTQEVGRTLNFDEVCKNTLKVIVSVLGAEKCCIYLMEEGEGAEDGTGRLQAQDSFGWTDEEKKEKEFVEKDDPGLIRQALTTERIHSVAPEEEGQSQVKMAFAMKNSKAVPSVICAPLMLGPRKLGVLNIEKMEGNPGQEEIRLFYYIATLTAMALENSKLFQKTEELANFDALTRLYGRRYTMEFLDRKLEESKRYKHPLSFIISDIDHFKNFNDTYGHQIGDLVLVETAKVFKQTVRNVDLAGRFGGEEFVAVLPETDYKGAYSFAERLRRAVEARTIIHPETGEKLNVTISVGVSQFPLHDTEVKELVEKADKAMYEAKEGGRNQVRIAKVSREALQKLKEKQ